VCQVTHPNEGRASRHHQLLRVWPVGVQVDHLGMAGITLHLTRDPWQEQEQPCRDSSLVKFSALFYLVKPIL
jgi:hypothetical protein